MATAVSLPPEITSIGARLNDVLYVGLTGGIGSGKSTLARGLEAGGAVSVSADELAREVVAQGSEGLGELRKRFGPEIISDSGDLDREALAFLVFQDRSVQLEVESILHPLIADLAAEHRNQADPGTVLVYDVPLLVENQMQSQFDLVVVVDAPEEIRLQRLMERGLNANDAKSRIGVQATDEQRELVANIWVHNLGTAEDLEDLGKVMQKKWFEPLLKITT